MTRKFTWALYNVNEWVCTQIKLKKKPCHALNDFIHLFKRARIEQFTGLCRIMFHIVGCKIRNARNVLIVDSFVLIVRGPETDSRSKSYGRLKFLRRHQW